MKKRLMPWVTSTWFGQSIWWNNNFDIYYGNCPVSQNVSSVPLDGEVVSSYINYLQTWNEPSSLKSKIDIALGNKASWISTEIASRPLISIAGGSGGDGTVIGLDFDGSTWTFSDVVEIQQNRISPFPSFLMDWVTRQIQEIKTKLTDFPTVFVILPDFSGVFSFEQKQWQSSQSDTFRFNGSGAYKVNSGIKEAYTFLSEVPLINITQEPVEISIPFPDSINIESAKTEWKNTREQWAEEIQQASERWSTWAACTGETPEEIQKCEEQNELSNNATLHAQWLLQKNRSKHRNSWVV